MNSSVARAVKSELRKIKEGEVFGYQRFTVSGKEELALAKTLSRLSKQGEIKRISKGRYYKPRKTSFGILRPSEGEIIKTQLYKNGKRIGYLTGSALYNQLGLTTQVPNTLVIARNAIQPPREINGYRIKYVKRTIRFTERDIPFLELLEAFKNIREIPDSSPSQSLPVLIRKLRELSSGEVNALIQLALQFNPATRALIGAVLEQYMPGTRYSVLKESLNPLSKYKLEIDSSLLPNKTKWNFE